MPTIGRLPLPVAALALAGVALTLVVLGFVAGWGSVSLVLLLVPLALATWYLWEYSQLEPRDEPPEFSVDGKAESASPNARGSTTASTVFVSEAVIPMEEVPEDDGVE